MSTTTINPYSGLATQFTNNTTGLDRVATFAPGTVNLMNTDIVAKFVTLYFPGASAQDLFNANQALLAALSIIENGFINGDLRNPIASNINFSPLQMNYIKNLIDGIHNVPVQSIGDYILDLEDNISKSSLTANEQAPLLMATMIGYNAYTYWLTKIEVPGAYWVTVFDVATGGGGGSTNAYNRMNVAYWVSSAMEGALLGHSASNFIDPYRVVGNNLLTSIAGAVAVNAGKVIFKWIPRVQPYGLNLNKTIVSDFGNGKNGLAQSGWFFCKAEPMISCDKTLCFSCESGPGRPCNTLNPERCTTTALTVVTNRPDLTMTAHTIGAKSYAVPC